MWEVGHGGRAQRKAVGDIRLGWMLHVRRWRGPSGLELAILFQAPYHLSSCAPNVLFMLSIPPPSPLLPHMSPTSNSSPVFPLFYSLAHPSVSSSKTAIIHQRPVFSFSSLIHFPPPSPSPTAALLGGEHLSLNHRSLRSSSNRRPDSRAEEWSSTLNLSW